MAGFNYGGQGDGTGWSSEKGSGPAPGGGGAGSGNGGSGSKGGKNGANGSYGPAVSKAVGNSLARSLGLNPGDFTGYYTDERGYVMGITSLVGGDAFGVNLGPAPTDAPKANGIPNGFIPKGKHFGGNVTFKGDLSDARVAELNKIIQQNARFANMNQSGERIFHARLVTRQAKAELELINKARNNQASDALTKASELISDMGEKLSALAGAKYKSVADDIANSVKNFQGKNIRGYNDAMDSLNKVLSNPSLKISAGDKAALSNAMAHINANDMANKLGNLSKGFKVAGLAQKVSSALEKGAYGFKTGDWGPLMLEMESWVVGGLVASLAAPLVGAILTLGFASLGLPTTAIVAGSILAAGFIAASIDGALVDKLNNAIISPAH